MKLCHCRKNETYHQLLVSYINEIGTLERPVGGEEISFLSDAGDWVKNTRTVGQIEARDGAWDLYLIRIAGAGPYRMVRRRMRRFSSQQIAGIVARYLTQDQMAEGMPANRDLGQGSSVTCLN